MISTIENIHILASKSSSQSILMLFGLCGVCCFLKGLGECFKKEGHGAFFFMFMGGLGMMAGYAGLQTF